MNRLFFTLVIVGSLLNLNASNKETVGQQWLSDLQVLVDLSNQRVDALIGIDKNKNRVRDDVEAYIISKYSDDEFQKDMFFKAAQKIQEILSLPKNSEIKEHVRLDRELLDIYTCRDYILYRNESANIEEELLNKTMFKGKILNTSHRLRAYIDHKKVLPLNFDELTKEELNRDKKSCLTLYESYENQNRQSTITTR